MPAKVEWPPKVPDGFPLSPTKWGYVKTVGGKTHWICGKKTPREALKVWHAKATALAAQTKPIPQPVKVDPEGVTIHYILGRWILDKEADLHAGNLKPATFAQYRRSAKRIDPFIGHMRCDDYRPENTEHLHKILVEKYGQDFGRRAIGHWRDCCNYADEKEWCRPVRLGRKTLRKLLRREVVRMKWKLLDRDQLKILLAAAKAATEGRRDDFRQQAEQFHAALWLAINGGYGPTELAEMTKAMVDLESRIITGKRGKTGATHICPLWPETVEALRPVVAQRPDDALLFRTRNGNPWVYDKAKMKGTRAVNAISNDNFKQRWNDLTGPLGLKIKGQGMYKLKHLHATVADTFPDKHAKDMLIGHALDKVKGHYVDVGVDRIRKLTDHIRKQLILSPVRGRRAASGS